MVPMISRSMKKIEKVREFLQPSISCSLADAQLATARSLGSAFGWDAADSSTPATRADTGEPLGTAWANLGTSQWQKP